MEKLSTAYENFSWFFCGKLRQGTANCGKGLQMAARDCKGRQGCLHPYCWFLQIQGDWLHRKQIFLFIQGVSVPPLFFLSGFLGGIQKGSVTLFPANFYHFDKFNCQNGAIKAVLTPPKWQIILGLGVVSPPKRIFFLFLGVMRLGNILHLEKSPKSFIVFLPS